jgi:hypothetical protein
MTKTCLSKSPHQLEVLERGNRLPPSESPSTGLPAFGGRASLIEHTDKAISNREHRTMGHRSTRNCTYKGSLSKALRSRADSAEALAGIRTEKEEDKLA